MTRFRTKIRLHETDAAGVLFFASQFKIAHDAYEDFLLQIGFPMQKILGDLDYFLPIVHAEADYYDQLYAGDELSVSVGVEHIGETSFVLRYKLESAEGKHVGDVKTVHVSVDKKTAQKITLPSSLRSILKEHLLS